MDASLKDQLWQVCYDIAKDTQWKDGDTQSTSLDNVTPMAVRYFDIAMRHADISDPNLVVEAVRFLGESFAMPPRGDDVDWLDERLDVVLYLFEPGVLIEGNTRTFLTKLRDAIQLVLKSDNAAN